MTPESINQAIAKSIGLLGHKWRIDKQSEVCVGGDPADLKCEDCCMFQSEDSYNECPLASYPNFFGSLDACAEFEKTILPTLWSDYTMELRRIVQRDCNTPLHYIPECERSQHIADFWFYCVTAPQRCEAFLRVRGLWKEDGK